MRYLLLIFTSELTDVPVPAGEQAAEYAAYDAFTRDITERGLFEAGEALRPTSTATTVRIRDGRPVTTDGPFAETKEVLGGFYLINAATLEEAIEVAARIPAAKRGSIEVRPIWEFEGDAQADASEPVGATG